MAERQDQEMGVEDPTLNAPSPLSNNSALLSCAPDSAKRETCFVFLFSLLLTISS